MAALSTSDLKTDGIRNGQSYLVKDTIMSNGRHQREYAFREWFIIATGQKIDVVEWGRLYKAALITEGKLDLFNSVMEHVRNHCAWLKTEEEQELYAAECINHGVRFID